MKHLLITAILAALPASAAPAKEGPNNNFGAITTAVKAEQYGKALELAKTYVKEDATSEDLARVLSEAGIASVQKMQLEPAAGFYRLLVDKFPESEPASAARAELVACYTFLRKLDACIAQAKVNLELEPESEWAEYWNFLIAQSYFRLWNYPQAKTELEAFLAKYPNGKYAKDARSCLAKIDPPWKIDEHGIVSYSGKYDGDIRLQAALKALPADVDDGFRTLEKRLGLDLKPRANVLYEFKDPAAGSKGGLIASTMVVGLKNKPTNLIRFYSEYVVAQPTNYRKTLVHELKHAGFQGIMGHPYDDLPVWIREGLAVWGSNDVATRLQLVLCNRIISGKDVLTVLNGIDDPDHGEADYLEAALAFEWLESKQPGNVKAFCRRLIKGESYRGIWANLSGMSYEKAIVEADTYCRDRVTKALGDAYSAFQELHQAQEIALGKGKPANEKWLQDGGQAAFEKWLADNPEHPAAPFARFCLARSLITAGKYAPGRKLLRQILDEDALRSTMLDDAQLWIGVSYNWERDSANAAAAFGVLLRDYSCSQSAKQVVGKFPAAGPVTHKSQKSLPLPGEVFEVEGRAAFVILPAAANLRMNRPTPWVWYAPTLPGLPEARERWMFERFLTAGIAVAGVDVGESYGNPQGRAQFSALYRELVERRGFSRKPCLLARSRGGLMLYNWAAEHPDSVGCIAGIYPVSNLRSWPGLNQACGAYGLTAEQLGEQLTQHNPIDRLAPLAKAGVPIFHIHGDSDKVVPLDANSATVASRYRELGGSMRLRIPPGQGHNLWDGFFQCQELVEFVIAHASPAAEREPSSALFQNPPMEARPGAFWDWMNGNVDLGEITYDVTGLVRSGSNELKIEITNLWANRLVGDAKLPREQRVTRITQIVPIGGPHESGLFGPVRLSVGKSAN